MKSIKSICKEYNITNYTINDDGSVDVNGDVYLSNLNLTKLPLKFGSVSGSFYCNNNYLTTLEGSPETIGGDFHCSINDLTDLKGSPKSVGGGFYCRSNDLTNLEFSPETIGGGFYCFNNPIGSISGEMDIDFIRAFNTFKVIKGNKVNLKRLKYVMGIFDKPIDLNKIKKYYEID